MTLIIRPMREDDAPSVVAMVHGLARDAGSDVVPKLTPENLIAERDLIDVTIAEDGGSILGACLALLTYSTWRDAKGLYVVDLFIDGKSRNRGIGLKLLREADAAEVLNISIATLKRDWEFARTWLASQLAD